MEGFDPKTSFGYEVSKRYDAVGTRGDEQEIVAFLAGSPPSKTLEFATGTGRIAEHGHADRGRRGQGQALGH